MEYDRWETYERARQSCEEGAMTATTATTREGADWLRPVRQRGVSDVARPLNLFSTYDPFELGE